jgi:hypothetical protein
MDRIPNSRGVANRVVPRVNSYPIKVTLPSLQNLPTIAVGEQNGYKDHEKKRILREKEDGKNRVCLKEQAARALFL